MDATTTLPERPTDRPTRRSRSARWRSLLDSSSPPWPGYTSLAFRLAVRECGGLGMATTDLVNARSILENRQRSRELMETCPEDRPIAIQIYGHRPRRDARGRPAGRRQRSIDRRHQHGMPRQKSRQDGRGVGPDVRPRLGHDAGGRRSSTPSTSPSPSRCASAGMTRRRRRLSSPAPSSRSAPPPSSSTAGRGRRASRGR